MVQHAGDNEQGTKLMGDAMKSLEKHINNPTIKDKKTIMHIKYAQLLSNYGLILQENGELEKAQEHLEEALQLQEKCLHENSIMTIRTLYYLGTVYHRRGFYDKAYTSMQTALERMNSVAPSHPYKAMIATGTAQLMADKSQPQPNLSKAQSYLDEAIKIHLNTTKTHYQVAFAYETLGDIAITEGNVIATHDFLMKAFSQYARLIERESSQKAMYKPLMIPETQGLTFIDAWVKRCEEIDKSLLERRPAVLKYFNNH